MPGEVDADLRQPAMHRTVVAVFQALKVAAHVPGVPTDVTGELCDMLPIRVVRIDQNHCIVRGASAERARARIEHAIHWFAVPRFVILRIALLKTPVGEMANKEIPLHGVIFRGKAVKGGDIVIFRQAIDVGVKSIATRQLARITACLQQQHAAAGLRQTRRYSSAAGARTHYHVLEIVAHHLTQKVG